MKCISQVIDVVFKQQDNWKTYLMANWPTIIGDLKKYVTIEKVFDETLVLGVSDSTWMQELYMLSNILINKINQSLDKPHVKYVRFKLRSEKPAAKCNNQTKKPKPTVNKHKLTFREKKALEKISDRELHEALENFLNKCYHMRRL